jgi:hypothetical protein
MELQHTLEASVIITMSVLEIKMSAASEAEIDRLISGNHKIIPYLYTALSFTIW